MITIKDKVEHFIVCFLITMAIMFGTGNLYVAVIGAFLVGCAKEFWDSKQAGNKWDWWDILADCAGIATFVLLFNL